MNGAILAVCLSSLIASQAIAGQLGASGGQVAGRVIDGISRTTLAGATVILAPTMFPTGAGGPLQSVTNANGEFVFERLVPGRYRLQAQKTGFAPLAGPFEERAIDVPAGQSITGLELALPPGASITQSATTPLRTGDVARQLTQQDVAALERVLPAGGTPWLLNGDPGLIPNGEYIEAYLSPTNTTRVLRRGTVISVLRWLAPRTEWTVQRTESYAQVAIPGRNFGQIEGDQDINRPFRVIGRLDDTELFRLVEFLRSNPPARVGSDAIRSWPILSINRKADDSVEVLLRGAVMQGQSITLRQAGQDWIIIRFGTWIA
jgi:hypothetical protein